MKPEYALTYARLIIECSKYMTQFGRLEDINSFSRYDMLRDYLVERMERNVEKERGLDIEMQQHYERLKQQNPNNLA